MVISIHALREEGDDFISTIYPVPMSISIHALREEGDRLHNVCNDYTYKISIHALREEGDCADAALHPVLILFLSTPSARRATNRPGTCSSGT